MTASSRDRIGSPAIEVPRRRVIKVGGSLLNLPDLHERFLTAVSSWPFARNEVLVGGGEAADMVRLWDRKFQLGDERAHWLAVFAMDWNTSHFARVLDEIQDVAQRSTDEKAPLISPVGATQMLRRLEDLGHGSVEASWKVTSDSIAAFIARASKADELVLMKSLDGPEHVTEPQRDSSEYRRTDVTQSLHILAENDWVDPKFPDYAADVSQVMWCNLRGALRQME